MGHITYLIIVGLFYPSGEPISAQTLHCLEFEVLYIHLHSRHLVFALTLARL